MADKLKNPAKCASARIAREQEDGSSVIKLFSCGAWSNLDFVNLQALGVQRRDTWVRPDVGESLQDCIKRIGEQAANLCADCNRFSPKSAIERPLGVDFSDPEYSPDPVMWPVGVPMDKTAKLLHDAGF